MPKATARKGQQSSKMASKPKLRRQGIRLKSFLVGMLTLHFALSALNIGLSNIVPVLALYAPSRQVGLATNCFTHQEHGHTIHSYFRNDGICEPADGYKKCPRTVDSTLTTPTLAPQKAMLLKKAFLLRQYSIDLADDVYSKVKTASNTWKAYTINPPKVKATVKVHEVLFSPPSQLQNWKAMFEGMRDMTTSNLVWLSLAPSNLCSRWWPVLSQSYCWDYRRSVFCQEHQTSSRATFVNRSKLYTLNTNTYGTKQIIKR